MRHLFVAALLLAAPLGAGTVVVCGTSEPGVPTRATFYGVNLDGSQFPGALINPDLSAVVGEPVDRWKCAGATVVLMTAQDLADLAAVAVATEAVVDTALRDKLRAVDTSTVVFRGPSLILANSVAETDLLNTTIPGGLLGTRRVVRVTLAGDRISNGVAEAAGTLRVYLGGSVVYADAMLAVANNAARSPFRIELLIATVDATNLVAVDGLAYMHAPGGATTGIGNLGTDETAVFAPFAAASPVSLDTTQPIPIRITYQLGTANAGVDLRLHIALVELL
jgi:hypothetical protein